MTFREASRETSARSEAVWRVWSDVNRWPEWNPDMKEARLTGPLQGECFRSGAGSSGE